MGEGGGRVRLPLVNKAYIDTTGIGTPNRPSLRKKMLPLKIIIWQIFYPQSATETFSLLIPLIHYTETYARKKGQRAAKPMTSHLKQCESCSVQNTQEPQLPSCCLNRSCCEKCESFSNQKTESEN